MFRLAPSVLEATFAHFRQCGRGRHECQVLWVSPWATPEAITEAVHPAHRATVGGFQVSGTWLNQFWLGLAHEKKGVRVQVHTHPGEAFHSATDDEFPLVHTTGFLSLVIPNFAMGPVGFDDAFLAQLGADGKWTQVPIKRHLILS